MKRSLNLKRAVVSLWCWCAVAVSPALALEEGLLGFWAFDEGDGTESANLSGEHRVVLVEDEATLPQWVEGKVGTALHFDESSYAKIEDFYGVGGNTPRTIGMWLKSDWQVPGGATALIGWGLNESGRRWHFKFEHTTQSIRTENQSGQNFGSDIVVTDGEWHYVASVLPEGGTTIGDVQLYVDGVLLDVNGNGAQTVDTVTDPDEGAVEVTIGMGFLGATKRFSLVTLDELAIWERGLSADEIQALANGARPISEGDPNLVAPTRASLGQVTAFPPKHEGSFDVRNLGDAETLEISGIDVEGAQADRFTVKSFPESLAPGDSGEVVYEFDSRGESGGFMAELVIKNNEEEAPEFRVAVSASVINRNGPVAHYRLDESAGSEAINDASGWDRHGTLSGGVADLGQDPIAGQEGSALKVAGGGQVSVASDLFEPFESFTVSGWVRPDQVDGTQTLVAFGPAGSPDWAVLSAEGAIAWFIDGAPKTSTDPVLAAGEVSHVAVTYSAKELVLYVDGEELVSEADPDPVEFQADFDAFFSIGAVGGVLPFAGVIDDIQFYGRALTAQDIKRLFDTPPNPLGGPVDSDGDGLSDEDEVNVHETDPQDADTDDDGLNDGAEVLTANTDPKEKDSDGGGAWDGFETMQGSDPNDGADDPAVWTVTTYKVSGTVGSMAQADTALAEGTFQGDPILRQHPVINFVGTGGTGNFDDDLPFDNIEEIEINVDDFIVVGTTEIFIAESGTYTFGFNSDDGGRLTVSGIVVAEFPGTRGANDSLGAIALSPGFHAVEAIQFERGGGSAFEVYWDPNSGDSSDAFASNRHILLAATDVVRADSDNDKMDDNWENAVFGDLNRDGTGDEDGDGLLDLAEHDARTDALEKDTDGDGLEDGPEVNDHQTLPLVADTDGDGRLDGDEINGDLKSDPLVADTDGDGFGDGFEVDWPTDPNNPAVFPNDPGEPDFAWFEIEALPTFDGFQGGLDRQDVSFRVWIDFRNADLAEEEREVIWESGGGTVGFSLVYEKDNQLVLRAAGNGGNTVTEVVYPLSSAQISAGELPVIWTFDVNNEDPATGQTIALFVDNVLVGTADGDMDADWTGSNGASFGEASSSFAAGGGNTALGGGLAFASGTINLEKGLQMYSGLLYDPADFAEIPDPPVVVVDLTVTNAVRTENGFEFRWRGPGDTSYNVEFSADLDAWEKINGDPVVSDAGGGASFEDTDGGRTGRVDGYYRAIQVP